jgi:hypothetical protein
MSTTVYKIQKGELFSGGGERPTFSKKGKIWSTRGALSNHLAQLTERDIKQYYTGAKIVICEVAESEVDSIDVADWTLAKSTVRAKELEEIRQKERELERIANRRAFLEKELNKLK